MKKERVKMTIYLDMDGVIADFFDGFAKKFDKKHWKEIPNKEMAIAELQGTDFFNTLEKYPTSDELVEFVQTVAGDDWGICSSPLRGDRDNSAYWKRVWLTRMGYLPEVQNIIFTGQKEKYATNRLDGTPNILIDDKPDNITRWITKGGIGIRYQANEDSLVTVKRKLIQAIERG
tara:strand:+ start:1571 stop:2095 length:525 start_codon:yes stop_codon:yes gene_type:complete